MVGPLQQQRLMQISVLLTAFQSWCSATSRTPFEVTELGSLRLENLCQELVPISCIFVCLQPLSQADNWPLVPAPQALLQGAGEGDKDLTSSRCVRVPTHCHSSLTGMLKNHKEMGKHLFLLSCFCSWTRTLIRYTSKKHRQSLYSTNILKSFAIILRGLGLDTRWLSLGFDRQQLWIFYSHWWWWWDSCV